MRRRCGTRVQPRAVARFGDSISPLDDRKAILGYARFLLGRGERERERERENGSDTRAAPISDFADCETPRGYHADSRYRGFATPREIYARRVLGHSDTLCEKSTRARKKRARGISRARRFRLRDTRARYPLTSAV